MSKKNRIILTIVLLLGLVGALSWGDMFGFGSVSLTGGLEDCFTANQDCKRVNCIHDKIEESDWQNSTDICQKVESLRNDPKYKDDINLQHISQGSCQRYIEWMKVKKPRPVLQEGYIYNEWLVRARCDTTRAKGEQKYYNFDWAQLLIYQHQ